MLGAGIAAEKSVSAQAIQGTPGLVENQYSSIVSVACNVDSYTAHILDQMIED